jgi:hypothetical protein
MNGSLYERMRQPDRRQHPRFTTSFKAELIDETCSRMVMICDLSAGGAMIEDQAGFWPGQKFTLIATGLKVEAEIRWKTGGVCGISFSGPFDPLSVITANGGKIQNKWPEDMRDTLSADDGKE